MTGLGGPGPLGPFAAGRTIADRYQLERLIAVGGMGEVWEALDERLGRNVAVKVLRADLSDDDEFLHRFRIEARTVASLNHSGVASIHDYGEDDVADDGRRIAYLVMELVRGEPLSAVIARGPIDTAETLRMMEQAAHALHAAHERGFVHRDVKPGNILIRVDGTVKLTDFGIAKAANAVPVTRTGMVMGTAHYIAPEQASGGEAGPEGDVYSLGIVGYECLAGHRPFRAENAVAVAMMQVRDDPPPLPGTVDPRVRRLIDAILVKDPDRRYADGAELAAAIAAVRRDEPLPTPRRMAAQGLRLAPAEGRSGQAVGSGASDGPAVSPAETPSSHRRPSKRERRAARNRAAARSTDTAGSASGDSAGPAFGGSAGSVPGGSSGPLSGGTPARTGPDSDAVRSTAQHGAEQGEQRTGQGTGPRTGQGTGQGAARGGPGSGGIRPAASGGGGVGSSAPGMPGSGAPAAFRAGSDASRSASRSTSRSAAPQQTGGSGTLAPPRTPTSGPTAVAGGPASPPVGSPAGSRTPPPRPPRHPEVPPAPPTEPLRIVAPRHSGRNGTVLLVAFVLLVVAAVVVAALTVPKLFADGTEPSTGPGPGVARVLAAAGSVTDRGVVLARPALDDPRGSTRVEANDVTAVPIGRKEVR